MSRELEDRQVNMDMTVIDGQARKQGVVSRTSPKRGRMETADPVDDGHPAAVDSTAEIDLFCLLPVELVVMILVRCDARDVYHVALSCSAMASIALDVDLVLWPAYYARAGRAPCNVKTSEAFCLARFADVVDADLFARQAFAPTGPHPTAKCRRMYGSGGTGPLRNAHPIGDILEERSMRAGWGHTAIQVMDQERLLKHTFDYHPMLDTCRHLPESFVHAIGPLAAWSLFDALRPRPDHLPSPPENDRCRRGKRGRRRAGTPKLHTTQTSDECGKKEKRHQQQSNVHYPCHHGIDQSEEHWYRWLGDTRRPGEGPCLQEHCYGHELTWSWGFWHRQRLTGPGVVWRIRTDAYGAIWSARCEWALAWTQPVPGMHRDDQLHVPRGASVQRWHTRVTADYINGTLSTWNEVVLFDKNRMAMHLGVTHEGWYPYGTTTTTTAPADFVSPSREVFLCGPTTRHLRFRDTSPPSSPCGDRLRVAVEQCPRADQHPADPARHDVTSLLARSSAAVSSCPDSPRIFVDPLASCDPFVPGLEEEGDESATMNHQQNGPHGEKNGNGRADGVHVFRSVNEAIECSAHLRPCVGRGRTWAFQDATRAIETYHPQCVVLRDVTSSIPRFEPVGTCHASMVIPVQGPHYQGNGEPNVFAIVRGVAHKEDEQEASHVRIYVRGPAPRSADRLALPASIMDELPRDARIVCDGKWCDPNNDDNDDDGGGGGHAGDAPAQGPNDYRGYANLYDVLQPMGRPHVVLQARFARRGIDTEGDTFRLTPLPGTRIDAPRWIPREVNLGRGKTEHVLVPCGHGTLELTSGVRLACEWSGDARTVPTVDHVTFDYDRPDSGGSYRWPVDAVCGDVAPMDWERLLAVWRRRIPVPKGPLYRGIRQTVRMVAALLSLPCVRFQILLPMGAPVTHIDVDLAVLSLNESP